MVKAIEEALYASPYFIKHTPVCDRPAFIQDRLGGYTGGNWRYYGFDHSSFEASVVPEVMACDELQLYAYMLQGTKAYDVLLNMLHTLPGVNRIKYKNVRVRVNGVRMSGDMVTSLGNGFTNLIALATICAEKGLAWDGFVEGDDGLFAVDGEITSEDFARYGHKVKMVEGKVLNEMGFCKLYYTPEHLNNVVDPAELLCKFGWSHSRCRFGGKAVRDSLLRAKADSLRAEVPHCPLVRSLVNYVYRCVGREGTRRYGRGCAPSEWNHEYLRVENEDLSIDPESRDLMDRLFHLSPEDQLSIEAYLDGLNCLQELDHPAITGIMKPEWCAYYSQFVVNIKERVSTHPAF